MKKAERKVSVTPEKRERKETVVSAIRLAVRKQPNVNAELVKIVTQGERLEVIGETIGEWTKVRGGYVMSEFVTPIQ